MLGFLEMRDEGRPPEELWMDHEGLDDWFTRLKDKYSPNSSREPMEVVDLDQNEMTRDLKRR